LRLDILKQYKDYRLISTQDDKRIEDVPKIYSPLFFRIINSIFFFIILNQKNAVDDYYNVRKYLKLFYR